MDPCFASLAADPEMGDIWVELYFRKIFIYWVYLLLLHHASVKVQKPVSAVHKVTAQMPSQDEKVLNQPLVF